MALLAVSTELTAMDIGMTIGALFADITKDEAGMAFGASDFLVHPPQWVASLVVLKLWNCTEWLPTGVGMAVFAGHRDRPMWIGHFSMWVASDFLSAVCWLSRDHSGQQWNHYDCQHEPPTRTSNTILHVLELLL